MRLKALSICNHYRYCFSDLLIIGGSDGSYLDTVELMDINSGTEPKEMKRFPKKIYGAVGTTLGECLTV